MKLWSKYIAQFVYGSFDGVVTTFAVVAAAAGARINSTVIVILALANLIADGFSMGASAYLSDKANKQLAKRHQTPRAIGFSTFGAFVAIGFMPVLPYLADVVLGLDILPGNLFAISSALAFCAFVSIGIIKAKGAGGNRTKSVLETLVLGVIAAGLAYFLGDFLSRLFGV